MSPLFLATKKLLQRHKEFSENFRYICKGKDNLTLLSRRMSVAKTAYYEFSLIQAVTQIEPIEKYRPLSRHSKQHSNQESFASLFQKATQKHAANKKHNPNGFDVIC